MAGENYFIISSLPRLGDFGSVPPMSKPELLEHTATSRRANEALRVIFLHDDLMQRQAFLSKEIVEVEPVILSKEQLEENAPLPDFLVLEEEFSLRHADEDRLWTAYYRHVDSEADRLNSRFLRAWLSFEVALRNAMVDQRAKKLELDPDDYYVCRELGDVDRDFSDLLQEWGQADTPLAGQKITDRYRWDWLDEHEQYFSFADDELNAYGCRIMLLERWHRITREEEV